MQKITSQKSATGRLGVINRISYVPAGFSLSVAELIAGNILEEGTPLAAPVAGLRKVCKQAIILAGSTTTAIKVDALKNHFKVGDFIGVKTAGKAYAITAIATASGVSTLTVGTAIDAVTEGAFIYQMAAEAASNTSALLNSPKVILGSGMTVNSDVAWQTGSALVRADVYTEVVGPAYLALLPQIVEIEYIP